jgi:hypothetical protein
MLQAAITRSSTGLHRDVQEIPIWERHSVACAAGFCTPGLSFLLCTCLGEGVLMQASLSLFSRQSVISVF